MKTPAEVEHVAKAIYHASCIEADDGERIIPTFERVDGATQTAYRNMAHYAIDALEQIRSQSPGK